MKATHVIQFASRARRVSRATAAALVAATLATTNISTAVLGVPGGPFPLLLRDLSCQDATSNQADPTAGCDPDAPAWVQPGDDTQARQVVVARNVGAAGSVAAASQEQYSPTNQFDAP